MDSISKVFYSNGVCACTLRLLDANGEELTQGRVLLPTRILFVDFDGSSFCDGYGSFLQNAYYPNCSAPELAPVMNNRYNTGMPDQACDAMWQAWEKYRTRVGAGLDPKVMFDKIAAYIDVIVDRKDIARIKTAEIKLEQSKIREY